MRAPGRSALHIRGIVDDIETHCELLLRRLNTTLTVYIAGSRHRNGLYHAPQPHKAGRPEVRRLAAHAIDYQPPACPAAATSFPARHNPKVDSHCRLPRDSEEPDSASSAAEDHWHRQRPDARARPRLQPWKLPLEF